MLLMAILAVGTFRWKASQRTTVAKLQEIRASNQELQRMNGQLKEQLNSAEDRQNAIERRIIDLTNEIAAAQRDRSATLAQIDGLQLRLNQAKAEVQRLTLSAEEQKGLNAQLQQQAQRAGRMTEEIQSLTTQARNNEATLAAREAKINDLTAELKDHREHWTVRTATGRRPRCAQPDGGAKPNIVDIHDADAKGEDTKAFGRVFYTEGKSLIFYAFDLNRPRVSNSKVSFACRGAHSNAGSPSSHWESFMSTTLPSGAGC